MKEIKLKPKLEVGEKVKINGKEYTVDIVCMHHERKNQKDQKNANVRTYYLINDSGERETLLPGDIEDIIESPAECDENLGQKQGKPPLKLRVGGVYRNRHGLIEEIGSTEEDEEFMFIGKHSSLSYREDGTYDPAKEDHCFDLIEEVQPNWVFSAVIGA